MPRDGLGRDPETFGECEKCSGFGVIMRGCCDEGECELEPECVPG